MAICENHFNKESFVNETHHRLIHSAIPRHYKLHKNSDDNVNNDSSPEVKLLHKPSRTYSREQVISKMLESSPTKPTPKSLLDKDVDYTKVLLESPTKSEGTEKEKILKRKLNTLRKRFKVAQLSNRRLKRKLLSMPANTTILPPKLNKNRTTFVNMQIRQKNRAKWSTEEKKLATNIFHKSSACYTHMRDSLGLNLPAVSTVRRWINILGLNTGINTKLMKILESKANVMEQREKESVLLFDEMSLKEHLDYNIKLDYFEGYQDLGDGKRSNVLANHALVIMLRGLYDNWKIPIGYYLNSGPIAAQSLSDITFDCINKTYSIGFNVRVVVCDQGSNNRSLYKMLGVTTDSPYFIHPNQGQVFAIFDCPHLFKSIRNCLLKQNIIAGTDEVSWKDVVTTYHINKANHLSTALNKITDAHIHPNNFQKMRVKLATQVFSKTFYAAMYTCIHTKELLSKTANNTANFLLNMNNLFDNLNSRTQFSPNPNSCALSDMCKDVENNLQKSVIWIKSWRISNDTKKIYCFDGLVQTINGILGLWYNGKEKYPYLLTARVNQDPIENLFSRIRQHRGSDPNPSSKHFRLSLQAVMTASLQKCSERANCEDDDDIFIMDIRSPSDVDLPDNPEEVTATTFESDGEEAEIHTSTQEISVSLETCSITYFAGYVAHCTIKKFNCDCCKNVLIKTDHILKDENELLIITRDYSDGDNIKYLNSPKPETYAAVLNSLKIFETHIANLSYVLGIKKIILNYINSDRLISNWLVSDDCVEHKSFLLEKLIVTKLYHYSKTVMSTRNINKQKLKNVKNQ